MALDEYGIPLEVSEKIGIIIDLPDNIDSAIQAIGELNLDEHEFDDFEKKIIEDSISI